MARFLRCVGGKRVVLPALIVAGALIGATSAAGGPGVSTTTPFVFNGTNPCTGEAFTGTGNLHLLISDNLANGGTVQFHLEVNVSGLQAVTLLGNKKYVVIDEEDQTDTFDTDGMPAHETVEHTVQFVRSGEGGIVFPDDDFFEHFLAHVTANANGTVTVQDVETDTRCR